MPKLANKETHDWQEHDGIEFHRMKNKPNTYFKNRYNIGIHTYVWETFMETGVPDGCCIHHVDRDRSNNDISNLVCMEKKEHHRWHFSHPTDETRRKMRNKIPWNKGKTGVYTEEQLDNISKGSIGNTNAKGSKRSEESRKRMSGKPCSEETRRKIGEGNKGHIAWNRGIPCSNEAKRKNSEAHKGKELLEEHKRKISKGLKKYYAQKSIEHK